jgi:transcriptional regulator GlxA family with amidase domain
MAQKRHTEQVGILAIDGFSMMSFACVIEPLRAANLLSGEKLYEWHILAPLDDYVVASNDIAMAATELGAEPELDTLFICAAGNAGAFRDRAVAAWVSAAGRHVKRIGGVSGGPYLMAKAGLLDRSRCTIHWEHVPAFRERFPDIDLRQTLFEIDGNRLTCGGGVAALDMMHALIELDHGAALAARVSDWFLQTDIRGGSGLQRLEPGPRAGSRDRRVDAALGAITPSSGRTEPAALSKKAGVSPRQLQRLFRSELDTSPAAYEKQQRLERARTMLRQTELPVIVVALECGFSSTSHFSRSFRAAFGVTPAAWRRGDQ